MQSQRLGKSKAVKKALIFGEMPLLPDLCRQKVSRVQSMTQEEVGIQHQVFCDPAKPLSAGNIQPAPWAEFALGAEGSPELSMLLTQKKLLSSLSRGVFRS